MIISIGARTKSIRERRDRRRALVVIAIPSTWLVYNNIIDIQSYFRITTFRVYFGVKTCEVFLCFVTIMFVLSFVLTSLFSLFYVTRVGDRFLHRGWANFSFEVSSAWRSKRSPKLTHSFFCTMSYISYSAYYNHLRLHRKVRSTWAFTCDELSVVK